MYEYCEICEVDGIQTRLHIGACWKHGLMRRSSSVINKFYVGAKHLASAIARGGNGTGTVATVDEAINEAKRQVQNSEVECAIVVQILYVVRKDYPPVRVEKVE